jgi:hypothetical protein
VKDLAPALQKEVIEEIAGGKKKGKKRGKDDVLPMGEFLDLIIRKVQQGVQTGSLEPTVTEGVKAAEIKLKAKEQSPYEKELVAFFLNVSLNHGLHH